MNCDSNSCFSMEQFNVDNHSIDTHTFAVLSVGVASLLGILLLCLSYFDVPLLISLSFIFSYGLLKFFNIKIRLIPPHNFFLIATIIIVAFLLRMDLYPHLMGGQDQGLYTNMAQMILRVKSLNYIDLFRADLPESLRSLYDDYRMASVPLVDSAKSMMTIEFYPMHPIWMAIVSWLLGAKYQTASLLIFSGLYMSGGAKLATEIFEDSSAGIIALVFLAINPILVFFSKYPVTEMVAFAFTVNGMLFLYRGTLLASTKIRTLNIIISVLCFNALFYTRLQFFLFIPFFGLLFCCCFLPTGKAKSRAYLAIGISTMMVLFALSTVFYYQFQPDLATSMFQGHIASLLSYKVAVFFALLLFVICGGTIFLRWYFHKTKKDITPIIIQILQYSGVFLLISFLLSIPSILHLYNSGTIPHFGRWALPENGDLWKIRYHAIYRLMIMLSPIGFLTLLFSPYFTKRLNIHSNLLFLFLGICWLVILLQPSIPYLYYYGRYLSSEMLPYSLIAISGILAKMLTGKQRKYGVAILSILLVYQAFYSFSQYGKIESEPYNAYNDLTEITTKNDIIVTRGMDDRIVVPLRLYFGRRVFAMPISSNICAGEVKAALSSLLNISNSSGGRVLYVDQKNVMVPGGLCGTFEFKNSFFSNGENARDGGIYSDSGSSRLLLPRELITDISIWYIYRVNKDNINMLFTDTCGHIIDFSSYADSTTKGYSLINFDIPEKHGRWSIGHNARFQYLIPENGKKPNHLILEATGFVYKKHSQRVLISVNHKPTSQHRLTSESPNLSIKLPINYKENDKKIRLNFEFPDAISPKEIGLSGDGRKLALSIKSIEFK